MMKIGVFAGYETLWIWVLQSGACLALGLGASFILRRRPARAHRVLLLAIAFALIMPIMSGLVKSREWGAFKAPPVNVSERVDEWVEAGREERVYVAAVAKPGSERIGAVATPPSAEPQSPSTQLPWGWILLGGWGLASVVALGRVVLGFMWGFRVAGRARPCSSPRILDALAISRVHLGIAADIQIRVSDRIRSPVIWCWTTRPVLLVPDDAIRHTGKVEWESVFCHELAHWKRRDHLSGLVGELLKCALPWNPLAWWAGRRLVQLSEQACDDWALEIGRPVEDYAESLLNLAAQKRMALAPAVVSTQGGLFGRLRRILTKGPGNPRMGVRWALVASIVTVCVAVGVAFAQTRPVERGEPTAVLESGGMPSDAVRVLHFPKDRSLGMLMIQEPGTEVEIYFPFRGWTYLTEAMGDVKVPMGKRLNLLVREDAIRDLSSLSALGPDDLFMIYLPEGAGDACMHDIGRLTGLRRLDLSQGITDKGMRCLQDMKSLEALWVPQGITQAGLVHVASLPSLKVLIVGANRFGDRELALIGGMSSLERLRLYGNPGRINPKGMAHLAKLNGLRQLAIHGVFRETDEGMGSLQCLDSLRRLDLQGGNITDIGLARLSKLTGLEELNLAKTRITNAGLAHLARLPSLKKLDLGGTTISGAGLAHLARIKSLERLELPSLGSITDQGLRHLGELHGLKYLRVGTSSVSRLSDNGLGHLAGLTSLEELAIGGSGITDSGMVYVNQLASLQTLELSYCHLTDKGLARLAPLRSLRELQFGTCEDITVSGLAQLNVLPQLTQLTLLYSGTRDNQSLDISGLTRLKKLSLWLRSGSLRDEDLACLANLTELESLQLAPCEHVTDAGMAHLAGLTALRSVRITDGAHLTDKSLSYLANMKSLEEVMLDGDFSDEGLGNLEDHKALRWVEIGSRRDFSRPAMERLARSLPRLDHFRRRPPSSRSGTVRTRRR